MSAAKKSSRRKPLAVKRLPVTLSSDHRHVIARFFDPGSKAQDSQRHRAIRGLSGGQVRLVAGRGVLEVSCPPRQHRPGAPGELSRGGGDDRHERTTFIDNRRLLIGSYLTAEYSIESAAIFNPSIVQHHNQRNLPTAR